jgi:hypothetical protein
MCVVRRSFAALLLVASAVAQPPALKDVHRVFPAFRYYGDVHAVGDVTGDGIADIVFIVRANQGVVWHGSADSVYTSDQTALPQHDEFCRAVLLVDVDGDQDLDCVTANALGNSSSSPGYAGYDRIYLNDGSGRFTESPASPPLGSNGTSTCVAAADIDGDGDQDLVFGRGPTTIPGWPFPLGGENLVYVNDGSGGFTLDTGRLPGQDYTNAIAFLDYDGDGDQDLYVGNDSAGQFDSAKL